MVEPCLEDYAPFVGQGELRELRLLARPLAGIRLQHINSTAVGGGVAEILTRLVPLMREVGLDAHWTVLDGGPDFFRVTKAFHNALHGQPAEITLPMLECYTQVLRRNCGKIDAAADFVVLHDPQPAGLTEFRQDHRGRWIWRCHIDLSLADPMVWGFLRPYVERCDAAVFHLQDYARDLYLEQYIIPPAIDPLTEKNRDLSDDEVSAVCRTFGVDRSRAILLQVSRFDWLKDPVGVVKAFRLVRKTSDCQLVLAGGSAADDPEGQEVLAKVREEAGGDPDVLILDLPPDSHYEINALQRAATVVVQKSLREGFGLVVTEAMWKGKPVVGGNVGGIRRQILHGETGYLVNTIEGAAWYIRELLANRALAERMGHLAREHVRTNYLLPHYLKSWLLVLLGTGLRGEGIFPLAEAAALISRPSSS
jgi:trehalose synthase